MALDYTLQPLAVYDRVETVLRSALGSGSTDIAAIQLETPFTGANATTLPTFAANDILIQPDDDPTYAPQGKGPALWIIPEEGRPGSQGAPGGTGRGEVRGVVRLWVPSAGWPSTQRDPTLRRSTMRVCMGLLSAVIAVLERDVVKSGEVYSCLVERYRPRTIKPEGRKHYLLVWDILWRAEGRHRNSFGT